MKPILYVLALALGALTFQSCEDYPNGLPVATTTAAITLAAVTIPAITATAITMAVVRLLRR